MAAVLIVMVDGGRLSLVCAECATAAQPRRRGWSVPMRNADAVAAVLVAAADHGELEHQTDTESTKNALKIIDDGR